MPPKRASKLHPQAILSTTGRLSSSVQKTRFGTVGALTWRLSLHRTTQTRPLRLSSLPRCFTLTFTPMAAFALIYCSMHGHPCTMWAAFWHRFSLCWLTQMWIRLPTTQPQSCTARTTKSTAPASSTSSSKARSMSTMRKQMTIKMLKLIQMKKHLQMLINPKQTRLRTHQLRRLGPAMRILLPLTRVHKKSQNKRKTTTKELWTSTKPIEYVFFFSLNTNKLT